MENKILRYDVLIAYFDVANTKYYSNEKISFRYNEDCKEEMMFLHISTAYEYAIYLAWKHLENKILIDQDESFIPRRNKQGEICGYINLNHVISCEIQSIEREK